MPGGGFATVGGNDMLVLANLPGVSNGTNALAPDQIQALIAAGADPSDITDATAAGGYNEPAGEPGEGQHDFVVVDQLAARGNLTPGFETGTFGDIFPRNWEYDGRYLEVPQDRVDLPPGEPGIKVPEPQEPGTSADPNNPSAPPSVTDGTATVWESMLAGGTANASDANKATVTGKFTVTANGDAAILTIVGEDGKTAQIAVDANGNAALPDGGLTVETGKGTLTITGIANGVASYEYELTGPVRNNGEGNQDFDTDSFNLSISRPGGETVMEDALTITIIDDAPLISASEVSHTLVDGEYVTTHDFVNKGFDEWESTTTNSSDGHVRFGTLNGLQIYGSSVKYEDGRVIDTKGKDTGDNNTDANLYDWRHLSLSEDGLSVGGGNSYGKQDNIAASGDGTAAEALVLETKNYAVSYGIELELGKFDKGDTAIITFCLTPRNSDDNFSVLTKEITYNDVEIIKKGEKDVAVIKIDVPDGFNKIILSAGQNAEGENAGFTLREINYSRPYSLHEGQVDVNYGADGGELTWDLIGTDKLNAGIKVVGTPGSGAYDITWKDGAGNIVSSFEGLDAGTTLEAVLSNNPNTDINHNGDTLLKATLGTDGHWTIEQYYNFVLKDGSDPVLQFTFSVTDGDGDTKTTTPPPVNLSSPEIVERFDNVNSGEWPDGSLGTQSDVYNHVGDILKGESGKNDLLFGRGGNDLLFGDGFQDENGAPLAAADALKTAFGDKIFEGGVNLSATGDYDVKVEDGDVLANKHVTNPLHDQIGQIAKNLDAMREAGTLDAALEKLEKMEAAGGDDALFGGLETDILIGGAGSDYLIGSGQYTPDDVKDGKTKSDADILIGGSGNDIIVYDQADTIIRGGSGIDVLLAGRGDNISLAQQGSREQVNGMEVLIKAEHTSEVTQLGITSLAALENYGVKIDGGIMLLDSRWHLVDGQYAFNEGNIRLTLETTLSKTVDADGWQVFTEAPTYVLPEGQGENGQDAVIDGTKSGTHFLGGSAGNDTITGFDGPEAGSTEKESNVIYGDAHNSTIALRAPDGVVGELRTTLGFFKPGDNPEDPKTTAAVPSRIALALLDEEGVATGDPGNKFNELKSGNFQIAQSINKDSITQKLDKLDEAFDKTDADGKKIYGEGNDNLTGATAYDVIFGMGGNDYLDGGLGKDILSGGSGNDILVYDPNDYVVYGGKGIDVLLAGKDETRSLQELLNQRTANNPEANQVVGGIEVLLKTTRNENPRSMGITSLNDLALIGVLISGDLLVLDNRWTSAGEGKYTNGNGLELEVAGLTDQTSAFAGTDAVGAAFSSGSHENIVQDVASLLGMQIGTDGSDTLSLFDTAAQQALTDTLAGQGIDMTHADIRAHQDAVAGAVEDISSGEGHTLYGNAGDDVLFGGQGDDKLFGGEGNDMLFGGSGNDVLVGGEGEDTLFGGSGNDMLFGGDGNDTLIGGKGSDTLVGGSGSDTFKWQSGDLDDGAVDKILDFKLGKPDEGGDILDISDLLSGKPEGMDGKDLIRGGYLNFTDIQQNEDGSTTVTITIDTDGKDGPAQHVDLAQVTMTGLELGTNPDNHAQEILDQLVNNSQIQ